MNSRSLLFAIISTAVVFDGPILLGSDLNVKHLRCEQLRNPTGIELQRPRLSWQYTATERGARQAAWQVLVASTSDRLREGKADIWDSGRVETSDSVLVPYGGRRLKSHEVCYWRVRLWTQDGNVSPWSKPAHWLMGILYPDEWRGEWIGLTAPKRLEYLEGAEWIWHPESDDVYIAPPGRRYFRHTFGLPANNDIAQAVFRITGDDHVKIYLNGRDLGGRSGPHSTKELNVTHRLRAGKNAIAVAATNDGDSPSLAGIVAFLSVKFADGKSIEVVSSGAWKVSAEPLEHWEQLEFNDSSWQPAKVLGPVGMEPWGPVRHAEDRRLPARYLRKEIVLEKPVRRASVSFSGLGLSEFYCNGAKVGDRVLSPAMMQYPRRLPYVTLDLSNHLKQGINALGVVLGNGRFYAPRSEVYAAMPTYGSPMLRLLLTVEHTDGTTTEVVSDTSWQLTDSGPIVANNEYDGEEYDARRELGDWAFVGYDDTEWHRVEKMEPPAARLSSEAIEPIRVTQTVKPVNVTEPKPGVYVFDMGQNIVGWCRLRVNGPAGTRVRLRHAETLQSDGTLALANLRTAKATDIYVLRGEGTETWEPRFTYHGFRYVEVTGHPGRASLDSITGCVVHDDLESTGTFECSNKLLNKVYENAVWGLRGNYRSVPTDCPQRDERQGWLGDRLEVARGESYVFDVAAFYAKWLRDIRDAQRETGSLPDVAPAHWPTYTDNVVWPSASILIPGILYEQYGDRQALSDQYGVSKQWMEYMKQYLVDGLISRDSYGDWCVPPEDPALIHSMDSARVTDTTLLASAFLAYDARLMQEYALLLGKEKDAERFDSLGSRIKLAVNDRFFDGDTGQYDNGTQTACVLPLAFGLVDESQRSAVFDHFVRCIVEDNKGHIATGLVGGQFLLRTLTDGGHADVAYRLASKTSYPSWGYMASQGATTIWELWNGDTADPAMNSHNHVMLVGDLLTWLYEDVAGIAPAPDAPGFKRVLMRPHFIQDLDYVKAAHRSPYGWIESDWRKTASSIKWRVRIPPGSTAIVYLPTVDPTHVLVSGISLDRAQGIRVLGQQDRHTTIEIDSGEYHFAIDQ